MRAPAGVPLKWILLAGAVTGCLTLLLQRLIIFGYVYGHVFFLQAAPEAGRLGRFVGAVAGWGTPTLHVSLTFLFAFWLARNVGAAPIRCGLAVGIVSAVSNQLIVLFIYPPVLPTELVEYLFLGAAAGALGGYLARRAVAGRESLYRASCAIGSAPNPDGVAAAIGEHLASSETREIGLWGIPHQNGKEDHTAGVRHPRIVATSRNAKRSARNPTQPGTRTGDQRFELGIDPNSPDQGSTRYRTRDIGESCRQVGPFRTAYRTRR